MRPPILGGRTAQDDGRGTEAFLGAPFEGELSRRSRDGGGVVQHFVFHSFLRAARLRNEGAGCARFTLSVISNPHIFSCHFEERSDEKSRFFLLRSTHFVRDDRGGNAQRHAEMNGSGYVPLLPSRRCAARRKEGRKNPPGDGGRYGQVL